MISVGNTTTATSWGNHAKSDPYDIFGGNVSYVDNHVEWKNREEIAGRYFYKSKEYYNW
jgi:prepilin-type processing-associated H-X9-DG protein